MSLLQDVLEQFVDITKHDIWYIIKHTSLKIIIHINTAWYYTESYVAIWLDFVGASCHLHVVDLYNLTYYSQSKAQKTLLGG